MATLASSGQVHEYKFMATLASSGQVHEYKFMATLASSGQVHEYKWKNGLEHSWVHGAVVDLVGSYPVCMCKVLFLYNLTTPCF